MNYFAKGRFLNLLFLDFRMVSNAFIDCPVSIAVELAIERIIRAFSCSFLTEAFIFMMGTLKVVYVSFYHIVFSHYYMSKIALLGSVK